MADRYGLQVNARPRSDGGVEVEPGGAPAVRPDEHELGGQATAEPGDPAGVGAGDGGRRGGGDGELGPDVPTKVKVSKAKMERLDLDRHEVCPDWNYTIGPRQVLRN